MISIFGSLLDIDAWLVSNAHALHAALEPVVHPGVLVSGIHHISRGREVFLVAIAAALNVFVVPEIFPDAPTIVTYFNMGVLGLLGLVGIARRKKTA